MWFFKDNIFDSIVILSEFKFIILLKLRYASLLFKFNNLFEFNVI